MKQPVARTLRGAAIGWLYGQSAKNLTNDGALILARRLRVREGVVRRSTNEATVGQQAARRLTHSRWRGAGLTQRVT
jgi:hypothetical protein